jgi:catechol 2,3-dioxygenase-like lactoylglutathione lyase family enzyme
MAYRFLLEVPAKLSDDANVAVASAGDAEVLVDRPAHGLGFDEPYANLTVAAHSLRVVDTIYAWANEIGVTRPDSRTQVGVVLHSGRRVGLHEVDARGLVAAIRRDQPWVERSVPRIGEHERVTFASGARPEETAIADMPEPAVATASPITAVNLIDAEDEVSIGGTNYAVIQVENIDKAEHFYRDVLGLEIDRRMRQDDAGDWQELGADFDRAGPSHSLEEADLTFMSSGELHIALSRAGRAAHLDYDTVRNEIQVRMDRAAASRLRAAVLMRGYTLLSATGPAFTFRDPFGVVWDIHPHDS